MNFFLLKRSSQAADFDLKGRIWPAGRSLPIPVLNKTNFQVNISLMKKYKLLRSKSTITLLNF